MSHGEVKCARVLPKDKIYRNIFDAEVIFDLFLKRSLSSGPMSLNVCLPMDINRS